MKVYIVTADGVEDHYPVAVFNTEEKARAFVRSETDIAMAKLKKDIEEYNTKTKYAPLPERKWDGSYSYDNVEEFEVK